METDMPFSDRGLVVHEGLVPWVTRSTSRRRLILTEALLTSLVASVFVLAGAVSGPSSATTRLPSSTARLGWEPNGTVFAMVATSTTTYIAGDFTSLTNAKTGQRIARHRFAAIGRTHGVLKRDWKASADATVRSLAIFDDKLIAGGDFTTVNGHARSRIAAVGLVHGVLKPWAPRANGPVRAMAATSSRLYIGGGFSTINGQSRSKLAAFDPGSAQPVAGWPHAGSNGQVDTNGGVYALRMSASGRSVLVGGGFSVLAGQQRQYLGGISVKTGITIAWIPVATCTDNCFVLGIAASRTTTYVGVSGPGGRVVAYDGTGAVRWKTNTDGDVQSVALWGTRLYVGGHFTRVSGHPRTEFATLNTANGSVMRYAPVFEGGRFPGIRVIKAYHDYLRVGGGFTKVAPRGGKRFAEFLMR
jgi:hypothetical protein